VIDIENGLNNLTHLKVSDFGRTVRYIPLETTDDGLVGRDPVIKVLKNHIVVEAQRKCLLFDKKDGKFIAEIGHFGQDPEAYTDHFSWTDEKEEFLYFTRRPNQLMKYDMQGKFSGKIEFPSHPGLASFYLLSDSEIFGYFSLAFSLYIFDRDGNLKDSIPPSFLRSQIETDEISSINVLRSDMGFGNWTRSGIILIDYKNDTRQFVVPNTETIWKNNEIIRFKEDFVDTIYTVSNNKLIPSIIFHTGKHRWPVEARASKSNPNNWIFVSYVSENDNFIFFQCIQGLNATDPVLFNGLFDKQTGETKLSKFSEEVTDDITHFMPFNPLGISTSGEFVSLVEAYKIMEWLDKHPEALNSEALSFLNGLNEDMNPVIILIE
jgi:hypothetical protein